MGELVLIPEIAGHGETILLPRPIKKGDNAMVEDVQE
jgi:hypothetical protein